MNEWIKNQLPGLNVEQLEALYLDVHYRIGTHAAGGNEDEHYINKQRSILDAISGELERRKI